MVYSKRMGVPVRDPLNDMSVEEYDKMFPKKKLLGLEQVRELREELEKKSPNFSTPIDPREVWDTLEALLIREEQYKRVVEAAKKLVPHLMGDCEDSFSIGSCYTKMRDDLVNSGVLNPFTAKTGEA